ncbi:hypothetical protein J5TS2_36430 [Brevibacillus halotolerans]|uniref:hypothetical protein n=1 Tax=Brevibacillus halotolerans TaxID=1507437 RepID=UPI001B0E65B3|nr:hypothetical protein [Brevibacillus halotolerans]GIO02975.1 hypothetical protein J5TS2_36430 [Brevibacillus halotolerans]
MQVVQISGRDIMNSFEGKTLLYLAVMKCIEEGQNWRDLCRDFPEIAFTTNRAVQEERAELEAGKCER